jgi:hypothetical protein
MGVSGLRPSKTSAPAWIFTALTSQFGFAIVVPFVQALCPELSESIERFCSCIVSARKALLYDFASSTDREVARLFGMRYIGLTYVSFMFPYPTFGTGAESMPLRQILKRTVPLSILTSYRRAKCFLFDRAHGPQNCQAVFQEIHDSNDWGSNSSVSGPGSEIRETEDIRKLLPELVRRLDIKTILDAPCGDFSWMKQVELSGCDYVGADVVLPLINRNQLEYGRPNRSFVRVDLTKEPLPKADLILCRDCLIHLSFKDALATIRNFRRSGGGYLLITTDPTVEANRPIRTGGYRAVNLQLPPFNFPDPRELHRDRYSAKDGQVLIDANKSLGLYRLSDLLVP